MRAVTISPASRLLLYIGMSILPVWIDFFKVSTDYTFRGLMMPCLISVNAAIIVTLAKTAPATGDEPQKVSVVNTPKHPVPVTEAAPKPA